MAITMTVVLLLLAGVVEVGRAFFILVSMRDAAQEGAIFGSIRPYIDSNGNGRYNPGEPVNAGAIQARARELLLPTLRDGVAPDASIEVAVSGAPCSGNRIAVTVRYTYPTAMPFFSGQTLPLRATVTNTILSPSCP